jgi:DNA-binding LacI/PurR family transcriptional regulator
MTSPAQPPAGARRATIRDIAETAGVSRSTASRALTGNGYVAPQVRDRVREVAQSLGYVPDVTARHLKQQTSQSIGVLVSDLRNSFYAELAAGISAQSHKEGYAMLLADGTGAPEREVEAAETFVAMRVAGVVVTPTSSDVTSYLHRRGVPVVEVDRRFGEDYADAVIVDNKAAARRATEGLVALGHERIALVIDEMDWTTGRERLAGYTTALTSARLKVDDALVLSAGWNVEEVQSVAARLLSSAGPPTAVFAANNVLAEGVWRAAAELGLGIPDELSLVAFDDAPWMSMVRPGITSVAQDVAEIGAAAVMQLRDRIDNPSAPPRTIMLGASIIERGSTAPPSPRRASAR